MPIFSRRKERERDARVQVVNTVSEELGTRLHNKSGHEFICEDDIREVWTTQRIQQLAAGLRWRGDSSTLARVQKDFVKVLSVLVWISWDKWESFEDLFLQSQIGDRRSDIHLPFSDLDYFSAAYRSKFATSQYIFIPVILGGDDNARYSKDHRMPFMTSEPLGEGGFGIVTKEKVAPKHFELPSSRNSDAFWVACKRIDGSKAARPSGGGLSGTAIISEHENLHYIKRSLQKHQNIMLSMVTFTHGNDFVIISDLADLDLDKFFACRYPSYQSRCRAITPLSLFEEAQCLADALEFLHEKLKMRGSTLSCAHLDLKPDNILVKWGKGNENGPVGQWLLHDFGISRIKDSSQHPPSSIALDLAPEDIKNNFSLTQSQRVPGAFQAPEVQRTGEKVVGKASDMWSFGCILAVLLAFAIGGPSYVESFEDSRLNQAGASSKNDYFYMNSNDGFQVKPDIERWLSQLRIKDVNEKWVNSILEIIFKMLKVGPKDRATANTVQRMLQNVCEEEQVLKSQCDWVNDPLPEPSFTTPESTVITPMFSSDTSLQLISHESVGIRSPQQPTPPDPLRLSIRSSTSSSSSQLVSLGTRASYLMLETPSNPTKSKICPSGSRVAFMSKNNISIYFLLREHEWTEQLGSKRRSTTTRPFYIPCPEGFEWNQISISGRFAVLRALENGKGNQSGAVQIYRYKCQDATSNSWIEDMLPDYPGKYGATIAQNALEIFVSCKGDVLFRLDAVLCCYTSEMGIYTLETIGEIRGASFSMDGEFIYCWTYVKRPSQNNWYIWNASDGELLSSLMPSPSAPLERRGHGRNIIIPSQDHFSAFERPDRMHKIVTARSTKLKQQVPDIVAGASYHTPITNDDTLVLVKHEEGSASDSLITLQVHPESNTCRKSSSLKLCQRFDAQNDGLAIFHSDEGVFVIACHLNGQLERRKISNSSLIS